MHRIKPANDTNHWYMGEIAARVVAESGRASDRFHLGKLILRGLRDAPGFTLQIDGATHKSETCQSVLERSVSCASALKALGLQHGDVIVLMGPNHLNLAIPFYAGLYLGATVAPINELSTIKELEQIFTKNAPSIVFCQHDKMHDVRSALKTCKLDAKVVTFNGETDDTSDAMSLMNLLQKYGNNTNVDDFRATDFNAEISVALLISTSGTTGLPKQAVFTHKNLAISGPYNNVKGNNNFHSPTKLLMLFAPLSWISSINVFIHSAVMGYTRLQFSLPLEQEHMQELLEIYKPAYAIITPSRIKSLMKPGPKGRCDFSCCENIFITGEVVTQDLINYVKKIASNTQVFNVYGMSEIGGVGLLWDDVDGSSGKPAGHLEYQLVDDVTQKDIVEPNVPGELWMRGPSVCQGYYKNPEDTKKAFTEDGWFKTGDKFKRDEHWNFYFVERIKMLLKYKCCHISPAELEKVICQHPGVLEAAVLGLHDDEDGELPVACVVKRQGHNVNAQEIKDLVKENLTDSKRLRGGVIFIEAMPLTATLKRDNKKLQEIVATMKKQ